MRRTSFVTGIIFPALAALLPGCGDDVTYTCTEAEDDCNGMCVDTSLDPENCGSCGNVCDDGAECVDSDCTAGCTLPEELCDDVCVDTQTSAEHCGSCGAPCDPDVACVGGVCAVPLAVMQTSLMDRTFDRDLFVLKDASFDLTKINSASFDTSRVIEHAVLPDGDLILLAAEDSEEVYELYRASPRGGTLTKLTPALAADRDVLPGIVVSRDGRRVLYRADQDADEVIDLYAVTLATPGVSVKVNGALPDDGRVSRVFAISADGDRAVYIADQDTAALDEVYTVDLSGGAPGASVKLNPETTSSIWDFRMTSDGEKVVFRAYDPTWNVPNLYVVETAKPGVASWVANADGGEGYVESYRIAPDDSAVFYTGSDEYLWDGLWRAPLAPPYDSTLLVSGDDYQWVKADVAITGDGARAYFRKVDGNYDRLFYVDVDDPGVITLLSAEGDAPEAEATDFVLSGDGQSVVFRGGADGAEGGVLQPETAPPFLQTIFAPAIYHLDLTGESAPTLLSPAPGAGEGIGGGYIVTADGARALYRADHDQIGYSDVYLATVAAAGTVEKVSPPLDRTSDSTDVSVLSGF